MNREADSSGWFEHVIKVSKRWHVLLSSPIVVTAGIRYNMGKSVIKPDFTPANLNALIKKRIRMERGLPAGVVEVPYGSSPDIDDAPNRDGICCSNGVCAWIEESTDRTTIFHWKLMSLPREEDLFDTAGEVKRQPKHVRLTDDAAIVSLCIHDKTYRATYLPWDFDSKGEIGKFACLFAPPSSLRRTDSGRCQSGMAGTFSPVAATAQVGCWTNAAIPRTAFRADTY